MSILQFVLLMEAVKDLIDYRLVNLTGRKIDAQFITLTRISQLGIVLKDHIFC